MLIELLYIRTPRHFAVLIAPVWGEKEKDFILKLKCEPICELHSTLTNDVL